MSLPDWNCLIKPLARTQLERSASELYCSSMKWTDKQSGTRKSAHDEKSAVGSPFRFLRCGRRTAGRESSRTLPADANSPAFLILVNELSHGGTQARLRFSRVAVIDHKLFEVLTESSIPFDGATGFDAVGVAHLRGRERACLVITVDDSHPAGCESFFERVKDSEMGEKAAGRSSNSVTPFFRSLTADGAMRPTLRFAARLPIVPPPSCGTRSPNCAPHYTPRSIPGVPLSLRFAALRSGQVRAGGLPAPAVGGNRLGERGGFRLAIANWTRTTSWLQPQNESVFVAVDCVVILSEPRAPRRTLR